MNKERWSNCLIEAIKAYIKDPKNTVILFSCGDDIKTIYRYIRRYRDLPHIYWLNKKENVYYHFSFKRGLGNLKQLLHKGRVEEYEPRRRIM